MMAPDRQGLVPHAVHLSLNCFYFQESVEEGIDYETKKVSFILQFQFICIYTCLKCIKLYLTTFSERDSQSIKMCCINVHFNVDLITFNKYCICKLLYIIVSHYQNKLLLNNFFFSTLFTDLLMFSCIHRAHPKVNGSNLVVNITQCNSLFCNFLDCQI